MQSGKTAPQFAGFWVRFGSIAVDGLMLSLVFTAFSVSALRLVHSHCSTSGFTRFFLELLVPWVLGGFLYYTWFNAGGRQTLGKRFFGLIVVDERTGPISLPRSVLRSLAFGFDSLIYSLGHLLMLVTRRKQALHDLLTNTFVIRARPRRLNEHLVIFVAILAGIGLPILCGAILQAHVQAFKIPTTSMEPSLFVGDYLLVDRLWAWDSAPKPGDLIVFKKGDATYIKRCVAVGGQTVEVRQSVAYVDGQPEGTIVRMDAAISGWRGGMVSKIEIAGAWDRRYDIQRMTDAPEGSQDYGPVVVPENACFVLGDNRDDSMDSRHWGPVPLESIIGKAGIVYLSLESKTPWYRVLTKVRWSRLGKELS